ncbi:MAG: DUF2975 domain-containing protein [Paraglaciecola sp.]|uniref:DUF2975 domain-containing protein n=1 Tax=Paraglaciecola sp. TaxID=1920173 RepID=UPI00329725E7
MEKIAKVSLLIRLLIILVASLNIIVIAVAIISQSETNSAELAVGTSQSYVSQIVGVPESSSVFAEELLAEGFDSHAIILIPELLFYLFIYWSLIKLFGLYQRGGIFTIHHIKQLRNIGTCLLVWPVFDLFYPILLTLLFRSTGLSDSLPLVLSLGSDQLLKLLIGLIIFVMSWIMMEGQRLQQEQELTI